jgi:hypothetical protein
MIDRLCRAITTGIRYYLNFILKILRIEMRIWSGGPKRLGCHPVPISKEIRARHHKAEIDLRAQNRNHGGSEGRLPTIKKSEDLS